MVTTRISALAFANVDPADTEILRRDLYAVDTCLRMWLHQEEEEVEGLTGEEVRKKVGSIFT